MSEEDTPVTKSARKARGAEPGPSMFVVLVSSVGLAVLVLGAIYLMFFKT